MSGWKSSQGTVYILKQTVMNPAEPSFVRTVRESYAWKSTKNNKNTIKIIVPRKTADLLYEK